VEDYGKSVTKLWELVVGVITLPSILQYRGRGLAIVTLCQTIRILIEVDKHFSIITNVRIVLIIMTIDCKRKGAFTPYCFALNKTCIILLSIIVLLIVG